MEINSTPLISIIVPVYNTERFLRECLDSIVNQTYRNLEIILVDDGSTDGSPGICDEYAGRDERVRVIHQENRGASSARNSGLDCARGDYILLIDSDDFIRRNLVETAVRMLEEMCLDCVAYNYARVDENGDEIATGKYPFKQCEEMPAKQALKVVMQARVMWGPVFFVCRSECWENVRFPVGVVMGEDAMVTYRVYANMERPVVFIPDTMYYYRINKDSATHRLAKSTIYVYQTFRAHLERLAFASEHCDSDVVDTCMTMAANAAIIVIAYTAPGSGEYDEAHDYVVNMSTSDVRRLSWKSRLKVRLVRSKPDTIGLLRRYYDMQLPADERALKRNRAHIWHRGGQKVT